MRRQILPLFSLSCALATPAAAQDLAAALSDALANAPVVADAEAALRFFTGLCDGEVLADARIDLPQPARRVLVRLGDTRVAFVQPDDAGAGPLGAFLGKVQNGIYALVWQVEDMARAEAHFTGKCKLRLTREGCVSAGFAIDPEDFLGARHEFLPG